MPQPKSSFSLEVNSGLADVIFSLKPANMQPRCPPPPLQPSTPTHGAWGHRSYTITATPTTARLVVDSYGTVLAEKEAKLGRGKFARLPTAAPTRDQTVKPQSVGRFLAGR